MAINTPRGSVTDGGYWVTTPLTDGFALPCNRWYPPTSLNYQQPALLWAWSVTRLPVRG